MKITYETERLILRLLSSEDAPLTLAYYESNRDFLAPFEPKRMPSFYSLKEQEKLLTEDMIKAKKEECMRFWIFLKKESGIYRPIGNIAFSNVVRGIFQNAFVGYKLDHAYLNKGYMTEALTRGVEIMFEDYGLHRLEANIMPRNLPSLAVAKKVGFYEEGLAKNYLCINGVWEDHIHMVIRNEKMEE